jgi:cation transport ATPase
MGSVTGTMGGEILHETARRLRLGVAPGIELDPLAASLATLTGVAAVRVSAPLRCVVVHYDGTPATRAAVLAGLQGASGPARRRTAAPKAATKLASAPAPATQPRRPRARRRGPAAEVAAWAPAALALAVPVLPQDWRPGAALGTVAARVLTQAGRLRQDPAAVLLDAASLASLAISGQPLVVSTSVLLRLLAERLSGRLVRQADDLLGHLLPAAAAEYQVLRDPEDQGDGSAWPLRALRAGDRVRLYPGDVVPVDGCVLLGSAMLAPAAQRADPYPVGPGDHVAAGERLHEGTLELRAEADVAGSRLERLRAQVRHAVGARDPAGRLAPGIERLLSLPLTASALVFGLTGDTARAAAMLQADPQQGLDLALPLAREAALYALARHGLLTAGLETIERLAAARTLVLQDTGVLCSGRWTIEAVQTEPGGDAERARGWLAALSDTPIEVLDRTSFSDRVVRLWVRHGAVLRVGEHEVHLASRQRLQQVWGLSLDAASPASAAGPLRRELAVVAAGRVVARVVLASGLRPSALERLGELAALGFERIAVFAEADGGQGLAPQPETWSALAPEGITDDAGLRGDWLAEAVRDGSALVMVHTVLRDLVPPGSLSLTPTDADVGSHGVLLGDPLASLVAARRLAQRVHRQLRLQQGSATAANAVLMTAAALRWLPPIGTSLLHHGFALLLLLDSLRIESLEAKQEDTSAAMRQTAETPRRRRNAVSRNPRSETA